MHGLARLCFLLSLGVGLSSCQTADKKPSPEEKQANLLESERAVIRNALNSGNPEAALPDLRAILRERPDDASFQNLMGLTQLSLKNPQRAIKHFQIAYKIDHAVATGLNLSSAYLEAGDFQKAVRHLGPLIKDAEKTDYPYKERLYHNMGYAYVRLKNTAKAEQYFQEALDENPTFFPTHLEIGRIYQSSKRTALALKEFQKSVDYCLQCYEPVQMLAQLYVKLGRAPEAAKVLLTFAKIEGVTNEDRTRANELLSNITTASIAPRNRGG